MTSISPAAGTGGRRRATWFVVASAIALTLGVASTGEPVPSASAPTPPLVQVQPNELRLSQPLAQAGLAVEGRRAAFAFCNQLVGVWRPGTGSVVRLGPPAQWTCPPPRGLERIYSIARRLR